MNNKVAVTVTLADGRTLVANIKPGDIAKWEREFGLPAQKLDEGKLSWFLWLAWRALSRTGEFIGPADEFEDQVEDLTPVVSPANP